MISDDDFKFLLDQSQGSKKILEIGTGTGKYIDTDIDIDCKYYEERVC